MNRKAIAGIVVAGFAAWCFGASVTAPKVNDGIITIDGSINESVWATAPSISIDQVASGAVNGAADCSAKARILRDTKNLYLAIEFKDDLHYAFNSQYLDAANNAYDDDGVQISLNPDYDAVMNAAGPYQGDYGVSIVKGFGNLNPANQYGGLWGTSSSGPGWWTENLTPAQERAKGLEGVYSTADGINYIYEARIDLTGSLIPGMAAAYDGQQLGLNIIANDNDGGFVAEGSLSWTGKTSAYGTLVLGGVDIPAVDPLPIDPTPVVPPVTSVPPVVVPANGPIAIDGNLSDAAWSNALVLPVENVVYGAITGAADCKGTAKLLWDDAGIYVAVQTRDDIHNAMYSQYLDAANDGYNDDGIQIQVNNISLVKGFGNLVPSKQFGGWWGPDDGSGKGWSTGVCTPAQQQERGWTDVFSSMDGLNYTYEAKILWNSEAMPFSKPATGAEFPFNILINDNDGSFGADAQLSFSQDGKPYKLMLDNGQGAVLGVNGSNPVSDPNSGATVQINAGSGATGSLAVTPTPIENVAGSVKAISVILSPELAAVLQSAVLTIKYTDAEIVGLDEGSLWISYFNGTSWEKIGGTVDKANNTITVTVTHFSTYGIFGTAKQTGIAGPNAAAGKGLSFAGAYQNGALRYNLDKATDVSLSIYDLQGKLVRSLVRGIQDAGLHSASFDGRNQNQQILKNGVYLVQLKAGNHSISQKLNFVK